MFSNGAKAKRKHRLRMRRLNRAKGRINKRKITVTAVIAFILTVVFYAMIVLSWWQAPIFMALGWGIEKLMKEGDKYGLE